MKVGESVKESESLRVDEYSSVSVSESGHTPVLRGTESGPGCRFRNLRGRRTDVEKKYA